MADRLVPDEGTGKERIVCIGEAPGFHEEQRLRPFVGPSGQMLNEWLTRAGLARSEVYITNVYPIRPPANKIEAVPLSVLTPWVERLHERLARLADPYVLVPMGNTALRALTGKRGITKHRGSIYEYQDRRGRRVKVIPTIHPAAILRQPSWERRPLADWRRIAGDAQFRESRLPTRTLHVGPSLADLRAYLDHCRRGTDPLAVDIETPREIGFIPQPPTKKGTPRKPKKVKGARRITCLAISDTPGFALTIPTTLAYWKSVDTLAQVWDLVRQFLALPNEKVLQNGHYDAFWLLEAHGLPIINWRWDTLAMHHALDAADSHSLASMASIDTRQPFWKDMKDPKEGDDEDGGEPVDLDTFWRYNGLDACVTRELADVYSMRLAARGLAGFYDQHYRAMFAPLLSLMRHGVA